MQSVTSATAVATTAHANKITLFASLELSKSKWVVTINSPGSEKFSKHVVEGGDGAGLLDLLSRSRAKAEQRYGVQVKAIVIQEAGLDGFWIHRLLLANGIESHVVDAALGRVRGLLQARSLRARHRLSVGRRHRRAAAAGPAGGSRPRSLGDRRGRTQIAAGVDGGLEGGRRDRTGVLPGPARQRARGSAARGQRRGVRDHPGDRGMLPPIGAPALLRAPDAQSRGQGLGGSMAGIQGPGHSLLSGGAAAEQAIRAMGAWLLFLPPYSPDLNPIEMAFAKLKALLRARAIRTIDALWRAIGESDLFSPQECQNYFDATGYGFT